MVDTMQLISAFKVEQDLQQAWREEREREEKERSEIDQNRSWRY